MTSDQEMQEIREVFCEESFEGLDTMESGLLGLANAGGGNDTINEIFRAAHSIKGGAGTFGFGAVSEFTHVVETLLDEMRSGRLAYRDDTIQLLLEAVDCLRKHLNAILNEIPFEEDHQKQLQARLAQVLADEPIESADVSATTAPNAEAQKPSDSANADSKPVARDEIAPMGNMTKDATSIRVSTDKLDELLNLVGELVITQSILRQYGTSQEKISAEELVDGLAQLERHTKELQESVMQIRMLPISSCFNRFPRLVHDVSSKLGKPVELKIIGESTELDKTVLEKISDPLVHLVRNALDHGIESPEQRQNAGKPSKGSVHLSAEQEGGSVVIRMSDDGGGLDRDKILETARERGLVQANEQLSDSVVYNLIFEPAFSTAESVSDLSGRGVGLDVVRRNITDLGGRVDVRSERGVGTTFTIRLPLTLAIVDGQLVRVGDETYVISLLSIIETRQVAPGEIKSLAGQCSLYRMRGHYIPVVHLYNALQRRNAATAMDGLLVIVEAENAQIGLFVDELLDQQQVVIKSLEANYNAINGLSGATILGDGTVALIIDSQALVRELKNGMDQKIVNAA